VTTSDYVRVLRKHVRLLIACALIGLGAAGAVVWAATPKYVASTQLFVAANDTGDLSGLAQGGQFSEQRVQSYAEILNSPQVTGPVATALNDGTTAQQIASEVSASAPPNTVLIKLSVTDASASRAQVLANAVSDQFAKYATQLETTPGATASPVKVSVVRRAALPSKPATPKTVLDLIVGLLVGMVIGVLIAVLRETLDTTVKDATEISDGFDLPVLGAIAFDPDAPKRPLVVQADPRSPRAEAFRQLRTNLQFVDIDHAPRSLVVSSSVPEEGKTTTATNLAITLAMSGLKVAIIEGDLRRPRLASYLGLENAVGVTNVLAGTTSLDDAVQHWGEGGLYVLASGPTPPNPSELLGSRAMAVMIEQLETQFDFVLIDAPPLLPVTDAAVLATFTSGAMLIVRHGHTKRRQFAHALDSLRAVDAAVYGVVLTMVPTKGPDAYYYGYNYRYNTAEGASGSRLVEPVVPESAPDELVTIGAAGNGSPVPAAARPAWAERPPAARPMNGRASKAVSKGLQRRGSDDDDPLSFFRT
jgi:succinoglycan biosynthesis transport protein ExoP